MEEDIPIVDPTGQQKVIKGNSTWASTKIKTIDNEKLLKEDVDTAMKGLLDKTSLINNEELSELELIKEKVNIVNQPSNVDYNKTATKIVQSSGIKIKNQILQKRLILLINHFLRGVRKDFETRQVLTRNPAQGGLALNETKADLLIKKTKEVISQKSYILKDQKKEDDEQNNNTNKLEHSKNNTSKKENKNNFISGLRKFVTSPIAKTKPKKQSVKTRAKEDLTKAKINNNNFLVNEKVREKNDVRSDDLLDDIKQRKKDIAKIDNNLQRAKKQMQKFVLDSDVTDKNKNKKSTEDNKENDNNNGLLKRFFGNFSNNKEKVENVSNNNTAKENKVNTIDTIKPSEIKIKDIEGKKEIENIFNNQVEDVEISPSHKGNSKNESIKKKEEEKNIIKSEKINKDAHVKNEKSLNNDKNKITKKSEKDLKMKLPPRPSSLPAQEFAPSLKSFKGALVSPVDELRYSLVNFRRLDDKPKDRIKKVVDKVELLSDESFTNKLLGIRAWRNSEVFKIYINIGEEGLYNNKTIDDILEERQKANLPTLTKEEFSVVTRINFLLNV